MVGGGNGGGGGGCSNNGAANAGSNGEHLNNNNEVCDVPDEVANQKRHVSIFRINTLCLTQNPTASLPSPSSASTKLIQPFIWLCRDARLFIVIVDVVDDERCC